MDPPLAAALLAVGLAAGIVSTLFGIGGGVLMVPALHYGVGMGWAQATAVSLAAIAVQSPFGIWQHARRGVVSWRIGVALASGGLVGVLVGDWLQPQVPVAALKLGFSAVLLLAAWRLLRPRVPAVGHGMPVAAVVALGLGAGVVSKLLGIGGGLVTVPVLALAGTAMHVAVGSSLVPVFTNAATATGASLAHGVGLAAAVPLGLGALVGVPLGARAAHALPEKGLRSVFAAALTVAAVAIAAGAL